MSSLYLYTMDLQIKPIAELNNSKWFYFSLPQGPILLSKEGGSDTDDLHFQYFDPDQQDWKRLDQFATPPHLAVLTAAGEHLYAIGGCNDDVIQGVTYDMYLLDAGRNVWDKLPSPRKSCDMEFVQVMHADGYIYVLDYYTKLIVNRFDIANKEWEQLPAQPIDETFEWSVPIAYEGKILFYGGKHWHYEEFVMHKMLEYNPDTNSWQDILTERLRYTGNSFVAPVLFKLRNNIYRIMYKKTRRHDSIVDFVLKPVVNRLEFETFKADMTVSVGEEISQDWIPESKVGAFRIQDDVFVNARGYIHRTNLKIKLDQTSDVDLQAWERFALKWDNHLLLGLLENSNVILFTFDKKKVGNF